MRFRIDARLRSEAATFAFRFACEDCAHFASTAPGAGQCSLGYPPEPRRATLEVLEGDGGGGYLETCKEFDLV